MSRPRRPDRFPIAASVLAWLLELATRLLARILNMPEPLLHNTGVFVFVQVQTIENKLFRALCPRRLMRQLRSLLR